MNKIYKVEEKRSKEELRTGLASYQTVIEQFFNDLVLCNNIVNIDLELEDVIGSQFDNETGEYIEIYQYYLTNLSERNLEALQELQDKNNDDSIIVLYSNILDCYVLAVTHYGTGWDYVLTNIKLTDNISEI